MPVILPSEQVPGYPYPLVEGLNPTIGWHFRPPAKGGPVFAIMRRTGLGTLKVIGTFPLNDDGWASGWPVPGQAESCRCPAGSGQAASPGGRCGEAEGTRS
ncbi:MAG TPA: hypothetical protein VG815_20145 [Chloroflexota bacterium]|nr:hypothetical protein [Chloroflexota bacterium]